MLAKPKKNMNVEIIGGDEFVGRSGRILRVERDRTWGPQAYVHIHPRHRDDVSDRAWIKPEYLAELSENRY